LTGKRDVYEKAVCTLTAGTGGKKRNMEKRGNNGQKWLISWWGTTCLKIERGEVGDTVAESKSGGNKLNMEKKSQM